MSEVEKIEMTITRKGGSTSKLTLKGFEEARIDSTHHAKDVDGEIGSVLVGIDVVITANLRAANLPEGETALVRYENDAEVRL